MPYVKAKDGTQLYVKDWGQGRPVVLIHGWPLNADSWDDVSVALADNGFRAIAYDRRGFGRSDQPATGYDYDTFADDLAAVIDSGDLNDVALVGFSMGGGEVARYLSKHGAGKVSKAALIGSIVPYMLKTDDNPNGVPQFKFDEIEQGLRKSHSQFMTGFFKDFFGVGFISQPVTDETLERAWLLAMQAGLLPTIQAAKAFATTDFRGDLQAFTVPTLIVHGTSDKTVPIDATAREAAKAIPNAQLIEYNGEPHGLFATAGDRLIADLLAFLGEGGTATDTTTRERELEPTTY